MKNDEENIEIIEENIEKNINEIKEEKIIENINEEKNKIIIHIAGEVNNPGIVKLKENARIADAIEEAGGITNEADLNEVNLAYILLDGQKIYIPNKNDKQEKIIVENTEEINNTNIKKININTATIEELQKLPGVGESMAKKIIAYRIQNGKFTKIEDIKNVNGIGEAKFNNIKEFIIVK